MQAKLLFFNHHGVQEYYIYDTETNELEGFLRGDTGLLPIADITPTWTSPNLDIRFDTSGKELQLFYPNGEPFQTLKEVQARAESAEKRADSAEERADSAEQKAKRLAEKLKALGIDPDGI